MWSSNRISSLMQWRSSPIDNSKRLGHVNMKVIVPKIGKLISIRRPFSSNLVIQQLLSCLQTHLCSLEVTKFLQDYWALISNRKFLYIQPALFRNIWLGQLLAQTKTMMPQVMMIVIWMKISRSWSTSPCRQVLKHLLSRMVLWQIHLTKFLWN